MSSAGARRWLPPLKHSLVLVLVVAATVAGGVAMLSVFRLERDLSAGTIEVWVEPGHRGALDIYVPLVDWGARFPGVRLPARLRVDVRSVDRRHATELAQGRTLDVRRLRREGEDALASYIRLLLLAVLAAAAGTGALVALAVRAHSAPRLRWMFAVAGVAAVGLAVAVALLLPPRGRISDPEYYAHGPDIPRALDAIAGVQRSARTLSQELDSQFVGLARLVSAPAEREGAGDFPKITVASDLHNNVLAISTLERVAADQPLFFVGDLTDRGSPLETAITRRIVHVGSRFVFVSGNHDSDASVRRLARAGAIVLTEHGRLLPDGGHGPLVVKVGGLRVAGYSDPNERRRADGYRDRGSSVTPREQREFADWLRALAGRVDVVMVHTPALAGPAIEELQESPPERPLVLLTGHTHRAGVQEEGGVVTINGGTIGGGGTGNLGEGDAIGAAALTYRPGSRFIPLTADLVEIDPGSGSAKAERLRLRRGSGGEG